MRGIHRNRRRPRVLACAWVAIACCFGVGTLAAPAESQTVTLLPGRSETLTFPADIGTALIVDPDTADVEVLDTRNLVVLGLCTRHHAPRGI